jgi:hypothetical protein
LSLERTALRLATVAALLNGGNPPYPTIADQFVYDSLSDDLPQVAPKSLLPFIVVRTDEDTHVYNSGRWRGRQCRLLIEMSVVTGVLDADGKHRNDWPRNDASLEAMLDLFETQVWAALNGFGKPFAYMNPSGLCILSHVILAASSQPRFSPPDRGQQRLTVRALEFVIGLQQPCIILPVNELLPAPAECITQGYANIIKLVELYGANDFKTAVALIDKTIRRWGTFTAPRLPAFQRTWFTLPDFETEGLWPIEQLAYFEAAPFVAAAPVFETPQLN